MWLRVRNPSEEWAVGVRLVIGVVVGLMLSACGAQYRSTPRPDPIAWAVEMVPVGTSRSDAIDLLADALCHVECPQLRGEVHDLFFYRICDVDRGTVVIVGSRPVSDTLRVYKVGRRDRNALHHWYDTCLAGKLPSGDS